MKIQALTQAIITAAFAVFASSATAQSYPQRPITLIIPSDPGGSLDITGRLLGQYLPPLLGQTVVVENVPGAGNAVGTGRVAKAKPDGYTLLLGASSGVVINPLVVKNPTYDGIKELTAVSLLGLSYVVIAVGPSMKATTFKDMIAMAKENSGKYSYGTPGIGSVNHLGGELMNAIAGVSTVHVPYKGAAPAINDLMGGRIEFAPMTSVSVASLYQSGKVRILASMSEQRLAVFPDVPTTAEAGFPKMTMSTFNGLFAPAATPRPIINQLHAATSKVLADSRFQGALEKTGQLPPPPRSPEQTQRYVADFSELLKPVIKAANISE